MTALLCPLCSQPRFTNLESLKFNLVKAATQNISCPICNEVLVGLDKLTIHLFGHSISSDGEDSIKLSPGEKFGEKSEAGSQLEGVSRVEKCEERGSQGEVGRNSNKTSGCTINMEDLGFLTSLEACLRTETFDGLEGKEVESEMKEATEGSKEENLELSEYMSDLLNKKLPILNFVKDCPGEELIEKRMETEEEKRRFECLKCDSTFQNHSILLPMDDELNHSIKEGAEREEVRNECLPMIVGTTHNVPDGNLIRDLVLPRYDCHLCRKSFKMKGSLLVHYKVAHSGPNNPGSVSPLPSQEGGTEEKNFRCYICYKSFKKDQLLTQHIKTHEGKQWKCETCSKSFTTKYFLKKHQRLHTGEMPYSCQTCNKTFTFQQSYRKHLLYHSDEKPHKCTQCGRAFKELSTLHNHQRIHSGEKPFACETCGKCFRQRVSYIVHQRIHTGVLPYECTACRKKYRYKVSQRSHKCASQPPGAVVRVSPVRPPQTTTTDALLHPP